ncbi:hypothetical protein ACFWDI_34155 [Streptomyces sp. NPDC060064]|uniref:hypothetical protein n=1 Tax=Streptomyces sp. NPDC060064 TaxID=3347049 RepID=UPI0036987329
MGLLDPINALGEIAVDVLACGPAASRRCPPRKTLRTAGRSPFTVVVDRADDVRFTRTVLAAHHPAAGRVVVHPTVGGGDRLLWHDVLHAVADGRPLRAPSCAALGTEPAQERSARTALKAAAVHRMTVLRAHRIGLGVWADLMALHHATGTDVTVVHHAELPVDLAHLLRHCDHRILTAYAAVRALHPPAGTSGESWADQRHQ